MDPFPAGITGFFSGDVPPGRAIAYPEFKRHLYTAARLSNCRVCRCHEALCVENYYRAILEDDSGQFQLLCNFIAAYVAFCQIDGCDRASFSYLEKPALASALKTLFQYTVLSTDELNQPANEPLLSQLNAVEMNQVRSWRPQTIGEIVFNHWD